MGISSCIIIQQINPNSNTIHNTDLLIILLKIFDLENGQVSNPYDIWDPATSSADFNCYPDVSH